VGILELGSVSLRPLAGADYTTVEPILRVTPSEVLELPPSEAAFRGLLERVSRHPWGLPMLCFDGAEPVAAFMLALPSPKNLNASVVALAIEPASSATMLALYLRHAFWSFPLHRIFAEVPLTPASAPHESLYVAAGFQREGVFRAHYFAGDAPADVSVLGLLRAEFDAWCAVHEPAISLAP